MKAEAINPRLVKFIWAAAIFFAWSLIMGALMSQESIRVFVEAGPGHMVSVAHTHIGLMGWLALGLMAALYYIVPLISSKPIVWPKLIEYIFWIFVICTAVADALMIIAGVAGGSAFAAGVTGAQLGAIIMPYAMPAVLLCTISVIAGLMFVVQILTSLARGSKAA